MSIYQVSCNHTCVGVRQALSQQSRNGHGKWPLMPCRPAKRRKWKAFANTLHGHMQMEGLETIYTTLAG